MGMWHRPFEKNLDEVKQTLTELKSLGMTELFVETYFNGQLIYESGVSLLQIHSFVGHYGPYGRNLLLAFIEEGKKCNIKIHAWVENFFVGRFEHVEDSFWFLNHSTWILKNRDQSYLQKNEVNYLFLDPANPEVQSYTLSIYEELMSIKGLASIHLDYIRYPLVYQVLPPQITDDVGYTDVTFNGFSKEYKVTGDIYKRVLEPDIYQKWCAYKMKIINDFIEKVYEMSLWFKCPISIAIFGDPNHAKIHKMQDWYKWIEKKMIDLVIPMAYYQASIKVFEEVSKLNKLVNHRAKVYAGIAPAYMKLSVIEHDLQIKASLDAGAEGVIMFATQSYLSHNFMGISDRQDEVQAMLKRWKGKSDESMD